MYLRSDSVKKLMFKIYFVVIRVKYGKITQSSDETLIYYAINYITMLQYVILPFRFCL